MIRLAAFIYVVETLGVAVLHVLAWANLICTFIFWYIFAGLGMNDTVASLLAFGISIMLTRLLVRRVFFGRKP